MNLPFDLFLVLLSHILKLPSVSLHSLHLQGAFQCNLRSPNSFNEDDILTLWTCVSQDAMDQKFRGEEDTLSTGREAPLKTEHNCVKNYHCDYHGKSVRCDHITVGGRVSRNTFVIFVKIV